MAEHLLVLRTEELKAQLDFQGFYPITQPQMNELYDSFEVFGMDRDKAEKDPTYKQFVAYSVIRSGDKYLTYLRGASLGEARLHGNRSMGIGGHIDHGDNATLFLDDFLKVAAHREIDEEIKIVEKDYDLHLAGLINDDSNEVGKVHLGLVYVAELKEPEVQKREKGIAQMNFFTKEELVAQRDQFETWSQIIIDNLDNIK